MHLGLTIIKAINRFLPFSDATFEAWRLSAPNGGIEQ